MHRLIPVLKISRTSPVAGPGGVAGRRAGRMRRGGPGRVCHFHQRRRPRLHLPAGAHRQGPGPELPAVPNGGAWTNNARADRDVTVTLPNHSCMITGRGVLGPAGTTTRPTSFRGPRDAHSNKGSYLAGVFDVAHDAGLAPACTRARRSSSSTPAPMTPSMARPTAEPPTTAGPRSTPSWSTRRAAPP